ncbi:MAG TPA: hypothetical protein VNK45_07270, partial [Candidatus Acidoferrales bacterium]|nr:hypothetical protein [Candidatus Acidoferrales bacterium]
MLRLATGFCELPRAILALLVAVPYAAQAAEFWTYTILDEIGPGSYSSSGGVENGFGEFSINNLGQVAYWRKLDLRPATEEIVTGIYVADENGIVTLFETTSPFSEGFGFNATAIGISDTGLVNAYGYLLQSDGSKVPASASGSGVFRVANGALQLFFEDTISTASSTTATTNALGQVAWAHPEPGISVACSLRVVGGAAVVGGAFLAAAQGVFPHSCQNFPAVLNERSEAAAIFSGSFSALSNARIVFFSPQLPGSGIGWVELPGGHGAWGFTGR